MIYPLLVFLWLVVFGPLWFIGWAVLDATKRINRIASLWCHFLMSIFPKP